MSLLSIPTDFTIFGLDSLWPRQLTARQHAPVFCSQPFPDFHLFPLTFPCSSAVNLRSEVNGSAPGACWDSCHRIYTQTTLTTDVALSAGRVTKVKKWKNTQLLVKQNIPFPFSGIMCFFFKEHVKSWKDREDWTKRVKHHGRNWADSNVNKNKHIQQKKYSQCLLKCLVLIMLTTENSTGDKISSCHYLPRRSWLKIQLVWNTETR